MSSQAEYRVGDCVRVARYTENYHYIAPMRAYVGHCYRIVEILSPDDALPNMIGVENVHGDQCCY